MDTFTCIELSALLIGLTPLYFGRLTVLPHLGEWQNSIKTDKNIGMGGAKEVTDDRILQKVQVILMQTARHAAVALDRPLQSRERYVLRE